MMQTRSAQVLDRIRELTLEANRTWNITLPQIQVRFDLRGRSAGIAQRKSGVYSLRFNRDMMLNESWDHIINDTVPHELAHIICLFKEWDRGHGTAWRTVCQKLGGTGARCHTEPVEYAHGTYHYTTTTGHVIALSLQRHRAIQNGKSYTVRDRGCDRGSLDRSCLYTTQLALTPTPSAGCAKSGAGIQGKSKAEQVRDYLRQQRADTGSEAYERTIRWAVDELGMSPTLARTYVKNNWNRV